MFGFAPGGILVLRSMGGRDESCGPTLSADVDYGELSRRYVRILIVQL